MLLYICPHATAYAAAGAGQAALSPIRVLMLLYIRPQATAYAVAWARHLSPQQTASSMRTHMYYRGLKRQQRAARTREP